MISFYRTPSVGIMTRCVERTGRKGRAASRRRSFSRPRRCRSASVRDAIPRSQECLGSESPAGARRAGCAARTSPRRRTNRIALLVHRHDHPAPLAELHAFDGNARPEGQPQYLPHARSLAEAVGPANLTRKARQNAVNGSPTQSRRREQKFGRRITSCKGRRPDKTAPSCTLFVTE